MRLPAQPAGFISIYRDTTAFPQRVEGHSTKASGSLEKSARKLCVSLPGSITSSRAKYHRRTPYLSRPIDQVKIQYNKVSKKKASQARTAVRRNLCALNRPSQLPSNPKPGGNPVPNAEMNTNIHFRTLVSIQLQVRRRSVC